MNYNQEQVDRAQQGCNRTHEAVDQARDKLDEVLKRSDEADTVWERRLAFLNAYTITSAAPVLKAFTGKCGPRISLGQHLQNLEFLNTAVTEARQTSWSILDEFEQGKDRLATAVQAYGAAVETYARALGLDSQKPDFKDMR